MSEISGFFNAKLVNEVYDRLYDAEDFADYFSQFISDGVFPGNGLALKVMAKSGHTVTVKKGSAFIEGYWYRLTEDTDITLSINSTSRTIYDVIVVVLDRENRIITLQKREDVSSFRPINDGVKHELVLCAITLNSGASSIGDHNIEDKRVDNEYCGYVTGLVDQIDVNFMYTQFKSQFELWFKTIVDQLSEDAAGNLQLQIDGMKSKVKTLVLEKEASRVSASVTLPDEFTPLNTFIVSAMYTRYKSGGDVYEEWGMCSDIGAMQKIVVSDLFGPTGQPVYGVAISTVGTDYTSEKLRFKVMIMRV